MNARMKENREKIYWSRKTQNKRKNPKQLQTNNVFANNITHPNAPNKKINILLAWRLWKYPKNWKGVTNELTDLLHIRWPTVFARNPKARLTLATTPRCWRGYYSLLWIVLDPHLIMLSVRQVVSSTIFF